MTYKEKLLDPRWQKKRLKILERESFSCQLCKDKETTLHVHHTEYNGNPWDTSDDKLMCLCKHCHALVSYKIECSTHQVISVFKEEVSRGVIIHSVFLIDNTYAMLQFIFSNEEILFEFGLCEADIYMINKAIERHKKSINGEKR